MKQLKDLSDVMAEGGAALPWGAQAEADKALEASKDADASIAIAEDDLQPVSIQQLGLEAGARIEVCMSVTALSRSEVQDMSDTWFHIRRSCGRCPSTRERTAARSAQQQHTPTGPHQCPAGRWIELHLLLLRAER